MSNTETSLTRDAAIWAYRYLLDRDPESDDVINLHLANASSWRDIRANVMNSLEYKLGNGFADRWVAVPVFDDQRLLWVNMQDTYVSMACAADLYEPENTNIFRKLISQSDIVVDLGANIGWFTVLANILVGATGHVHAFEPHPVIARYLQRTIDINRQSRNITLYESAVWDSRGTTHLHWEVGAKNPGGSHLITDDTSSESAEGSVVRLLTLDSLELDRLDFIKMDVEGAEAKAMMGAKETLSKFRPVILSEVLGSRLRTVSNASVSDYFDIMEDFGYRAFGTRDVMAGEIIHAADLVDIDVTDVLFVHAANADKILPRL